MKKLLLILFVVFFACQLANGSADEGTLKTFRFDKQTLKGWRERIFAGRVEYWIDEEDGESFLHGRSKSSCSALYKSYPFKAKDHPYICWKWKVLRFPEKNKSSKTARIDDYAARFYVIFLGWSFSASRFIEYVWDEDLPEGTIMTSPLAKNIKQIVIRSGTEFDGKWVREERNIYQDYKNAFGKFPSRSIKIIALMSDSDETQSTSELLFSEISIGSKN